MMKKWLLTIFFGIGVLVLSTALFAEAGKTTMGVVTGDRVNVRGRPLGTAERCCQLDIGDKVEIVGKKTVTTPANSVEEWTQIVVPEKATVWVQSGLIGDGGTIKKKTNGRAGPSLMWPVLCEFAAGDTVTARTNHLDWTGIVPPHSATAWISSRFVSNIVEQAPAPAPAAAPATTTPPPSVPVQPLDEEVKDPPVKESKKEEPSAETKEESNEGMK